MQVNTSNHSQRSFTGVGVLALVASVVLHVGLFRVNPHLLLGGAELRPPRTERRHADLKVREAPERSLDRELPRLLDRLGDAVPEKNADPILEEMPRTDPDVFSDLQPEMPQLQPSIASAPLLDDLPEPPPGESSWQPREEVLAITEQRIEEALDVLPRQFRDVNNDVKGAPDFSVPAGELPDVSSGEWIAGLDKGGIPGGASPLSGESSSLWIPVALPPPDIPVVEPPSDLPEIKDLELELPTEITELDPVETLLLLETQAVLDPEDPSIRYVKIQILRNGIESLPVLPRDVVFMVDCSASMTQRKVEDAAKGVISALSTLNEKDTFNVMAFRDDVDVLYDKNRHMSVVRKAGARTFLTGLEARGRTDVFASLDALLDFPSSATRPLQAMLVTDGVPTHGVTDTGDILAQFSRENQGRISVFGVGGGKRVNRLLLDFLSFQNRGHSVVAPGRDGLSESVLRAAREVARPVMTNLSYRFTGSGSVDVYPKRLSHLYLDRPLLLIARVPAELDTLAFQMVGTSEKGSHDLVFSLDPRAAPEGPVRLRGEWAWQALLQQMATAIESGSPQALQDVRDLADRYGLNLPEEYESRLKP